MHHLDLFLLGHLPDHEVFDDSVGFGALVVTLTTQRGKVLTGLWSVLASQRQHSDPMLGSTHTLAAGCRESGEITAALKAAGSSPWMLGF